VIRVLFEKPGQMNKNGTAIAWWHTFDTESFARWMLCFNQAEDPEGWGEVVISVVEEVS
jgi:hypothetical protein